MTYLDSDVESSKNNPIEDYILDTRKTVCELKQVNDEEDEEIKGWREVALPALSFAGVQLAWAVLIGHATAHLRKLGLPDSEVGLAWLAGPVTGTLVQPVVGQFSDRCRSRLGRRRPFMIGGCCMTVLGLLLFSNSGEIARLLGDPVSKSGGGSRTGLLIGVAAFWIVDFAINLLQTPTRALLTDVVPIRQLALGNSFFAVANGVGKSIGYALGAFTSGIRVTFAAAALIIVTLTGITVAFVDEQQRMGTKDEESTGIVSVISRCVRRSFTALRDMPDGIMGVFVVQWFTYLGLMYIVIYGCDWVGREVFGGSADAAPGSAAHRLFEEGVQFGNGALLGMAVLSMLFAPLVPIAGRILGVRRLWAASLMITGVSLILNVLRPGRIGAAILLCSIFPTLSSAFTTPWAIVTAILKEMEEEEVGLHVATFNLSQATPGLVASVSGGFIVRAARGNLDAVIAVAGGANLVAALAVAFVTVPQRCKDEDVYNV